MPLSDLPREVDRDKLAEAALAILSLTLHGGGRVWKGLDWDLMDLLHEKGWVEDPRSKAKSVVLSEDGERLARDFLRRHFGRRGMAPDSLTAGESPGAISATARPDASQQWNPAEEQRRYEPRSGQVLYAKNLERVVAFYSAVLGFQIGDRDESHVVLESPGFQLVVLKIPEEIASSITITDPPTRRANAAVKPVFFVPSISAVRAGVEALGGMLNSTDREWSFQGFTVCDGLDPEGNVIQFREPEQPAT
jgi:catechol 2,3-dioxygenase-like lactoylglutathione lyase family enzyme